MEEIKVRKGDVEDEELLNLLNTTRDFWGDMEYFIWLYHENPASEEEENYYAIIDSENEIIGFRRGGVKYILDLNQESLETVLEYKHGSVLPDYQGMGVFSKICKSDYCLSKEEDYDFKIAFIRKTNIPFGRHKRKGWRHRVIPLYIYIISPKNIIEEYLRFLEEKNKTAYYLAKILGKRINLKCSDGEVDLVETLDLEPTHKLKINVSLSDKAVKENIENVVEDLKINKILKENLKLFLKGHINLFSRKEKTEEIKENQANIEKKSRLSVKTNSVKNLENPEEEFDLEEITKLYSRGLENYDLTFRRNEEDISHILNYPKNTEIIEVRKNDKLLGFAVLGEAKEENKDELWVIDFIHEMEEVYRVLVDEIERIGREKKMDSVRMYSDIDPGEKWVYIPYATIMWDDLDGKDRLESNFQNGRWKISQYDVF